MIFPSYKLNKWIFKIKDDTSLISYEKAKIIFKEDYDRVNPMTAAVARDEWEKYLKGFIYIFQLKNKNK